MCSQSSFCLNTLSSENQRAKIHNIIESTCVHRSFHWVVSLETVMGLYKDVKWSSNSPIKAAVNRIHDVLVRLSLCVLFMCVCLNCIVGTIHLFRALQDNA